MNKLILLTTFLTLTIVSFSYGQVNRNNTSSRTTAYWLTPQKMTPLRFLETIKLKDSRTNLKVITVVDSFPDNWLSKADINTLIKLVHSKEECYCLLNPLSSYIPKGSANVGGYAIWLIEAYKEKRKVSFGLYKCQETDKVRADKLIQWWTKQSK